MSDPANAVTITHHVQGQGGVYVAHLEGEQAQGKLEWEPRTGRAKRAESAQETAEADVRIATHTIVPKAIGGRGVAAKLVNRLIADARAHGFRIVPQCSYVAARFDEHPEWADLIAEPA